MPVSLPTLTDINNELNNLVSGTVKKELTVILTLISEEYGIPKNELVSKYLSKLSVPDANDLTKKQKKAIDSADRCIAKIASGDQCSRRHKKDELYCGSHISSRPFGEFKIDDDT